MKILHSSQIIQNEILQHKARGKSIAVVPTMGALHEGHLSLVDIARKKADIVVVTLFVNPKQFGEGEDYGVYPRTLKEDAEKCEKHSADYLFAPSNEDMYPNGYDTTVSCGGITGFLEGAARPGHFDGVTTVVMKLFMITQPNFAIFGQKDAQQVLVIRQMVHDLNVPVKLIIGKTVREEDGLAMSSRNNYLTETERAVVPVIYKGLCAAQKLYNEGERDVVFLIDSVRNYWGELFLFQEEYIALTTLQCTPFENGLVTAKGLLSLACRTKESGTRLIDNVLLGYEEGEEL